MVRGVALPTELATRDNRVVRPRDSCYVEPQPEFERLVRAGALQRLAHGYYVMVPEAWREPTSQWRASVEGVALGIAVADYGIADVALMGISAARMHGAIPRAIATGVVAVPRQRPALRLVSGVVHFVPRDVARLDTVRTTTDVTPGWMTSIEQTILDLAHRPDWGGADPGTVTEAIRSLSPRAEWGLIGELAIRQRRRPAERRARWVADETNPALEPAVPPGPPIPAKQLTGSADRQRWGVVP